MEIERLGATAQKIPNNVNHKLRLPVGNVVNFAEMLSEGLGKYTKKQLKELSDEVFKNSTRFSTMILNMLDLAMLDVKKIELVKKTINLSELVEDRVEQCHKIYAQGKDIEFELNIEPEVMLLFYSGGHRERPWRTLIESVHAFPPQLFTIRRRKCSRHSAITVHSLRHMHFGSLIR